LHGATGGPLVLGTPVDATLASVFCVPPVAGDVVNNNVSLPGPGGADASGAHHAGVTELLVLVASTALALALGEVIARVVSWRWCVALRERRDLVACVDNRRPIRYGARP
jgi:hypothetical protein